MEAHVLDVEVPPFSDPDKLYIAWFKGLNPKCKCERVPDLFEHCHKSLPKDKQTVRFVCISDIHSPSRIRKERIQWQFPPGDVLLVTGDLTLHGSANEIGRVADWLRETPYATRVVIAGNHDFCLDPGDDDYSPDAEAALKSACTYLRDSGIVLFDQIRVYGSPVTPVFHNMAFNVHRGAPIRRVWDRIPRDTDILLTHGPPLGHGDLVCSGVRAGCADLLCYVQRIRPAYHVFGHIHEAYGATTDGATAFVNAASCDLRYFLANRPLVFDFPLAEASPRGTEGRDPQAESVREMVANCSLSTPAGN